jgi:cell division protein ZapA (FtsZ GTPase activity inhibitor)
VVSTLDIAVLTLLNITDELFQERLMNDSSGNQMEDNTQEGDQATDRAAGK